MNPNELRTLADALEPMARAPRFEDFDVPAFCAWLRAQAEAEPVAWIVEHGPTRRLTFFDEAPGKVGSGVSIPLYTHPAPAAPQAEAQPVENERLRAALKTCVWALRQPLDDWKGECERKALDEAREALKEQR